MEKERLEGILSELEDGRIDSSEAERRIGELSVLDLGHSKIDMDRERRNGMAEVIFCEGKTGQQLQEIFAAMLRRNERVLGTRIPEAEAKELGKAFGELEYHRMGRLICTTRGGARERVENDPLLMIFSGGTSDMAVAEEAALSLEYFGFPVQRRYDVGVAGIHRLLAYHEEIISADLIITVAGMEGALASVVGGLASCPVIAVPTSIGYGSHYEGLASLLAMLNSCASGISVVNIDNGFGAAAASVRYLRQLMGKQNSEVLSR